VREVQSRLKILAAETDTKRTAVVATEAALSRIELRLSEIELALNSSEAVQLALRYEAERAIPRLYNGPTLRFRSALWLT
jgi:hypothetical protein